MYCEAMILFHHYYLMILLNYYFYYPLIIIIESEFKPSKNGMQFCSTKPAVCYRVSLQQVQPYKASTFRTRVADSIMLPLHKISQQIPLPSQWRSPKSQVPFAVQITMKGAHTDPEPLLTYCSSHSNTTVQLYSVHGVTKSLIPAGCGTGPQSVTIK